MCLRRHQLHDTCAMGENIFTTKVMTFAGCLLPLLNDTAISDFIYEGIV